MGFRGASCSKRTGGSTSRRQADQRISSEVQRQFSRRQTLSVGEGEPCGCGSALSANPFEGGRWVQILWSIRARRGAADNLEVDEEALRYSVLPGIGAGGIRL